MKHFERYNIFIEYPKGGGKVNERLRELRKTLGLTQGEFSTKIGINRSSLANYEIGRNAPIDGIVLSICREFNVNERWLRAGEGEMFIPQKTFSLDEYAKKRDLSELELDIIKIYLELDVKTRQSVMEHFQLAFSKRASMELTQERQQQIEEKVKIYRRELEDKAKEMEEPSTTSTTNTFLDKIQEYQANAPAGMDLRIARSSDHAPAQWRERDASFAEKLKNAKRVTSMDDA